MSGVEVMRLGKTICAILMEGAYGYRFLDEKSLVMEYFEKIH